MIERPGLVAELELRKRAAASKGRSQDSEGAICARRPPFRRRKGGLRSCALRPCLDFRCRTEPWRLVSRRRRRAHRLRPAPRSMGKLPARDQTPPCRAFPPYAGGRFRGPRPFASGPRLDHALGFRGKRPPYGCCGTSMSTLPSYLSGWTRTDIAATSARTMLSCGRRESTSTPMMPFSMAHAMAVRAYSET